MALYNSYLSSSSTTSNHWHWLLRHRRKGCLCLWPWNQTP